MNWSRFGIVCALLLFRSCTCIFYPPLFWQRDTCAFRRLQETTDTNVTKEYYINVIPSTGMNIICPNYVTVNTWLKRTASGSSLLENIWLVDKEGYDKCIVNQKGDSKFNRLLMTCDTPQKFKSILFAFHPNYNTAEPKFATGQHYYFISTSRGRRKELSTRKVSGPNGGCKRYHMKLHIYVCDPKKEDCVWEMPRCDPPAELYKSMRLIDGKLPAPTRPPVVRPKPQRTTIKVVRTPRAKVPVNPEKGKGSFLEAPQPTRKTSPDPGQRMPICKEKKEGTSVQLVLNFVLGGVALFMAIVIIILVCGLANDKSKSYKMDRPASVLSSIHGGASNCINAEVRYSDGHAKIYPILVSRTPPTSPNVIVAPYVQRMPPSLPHTPPETPLSNDDRQMAFTFPGRHTIERSRLPSEVSRSTGAVVVRHSIERSRSPSEVSTSTGAAVVRHSIERSQSPSEASMKEFGSTSAVAGVGRHSIERSRSTSESSTKGSDTTSAGAGV